MPLQGAARAGAGSARRGGAALLMVGGLLEAGRLIVFSLVSPVLPAAAGPLMYAVPSTCLGVGLIVLGSSYSSRDRVGLAIAGCLDLLTVGVNLTQLALHAPLGPAPSLLAAFMAFVSIVVAAIVLLADRALSGPPRWAIAIPALAVVLLLITLYAPVPAVFDRTNVLVPLGFAAAGALLLRHPAARTPRETAAGRPR